MAAWFDGTVTTSTNQSVDVTVAVGIAEHPPNNSNMFKGFAMAFTPIEKATGHTWIYVGTDATVEIKVNDVKYVLYGTVSGNDIVLNAVVDINHAILPGAVENNIDTQELLHIIYTSDSDVEFVLNSTCRFTLHKGNFNKVFDEADWRDPSAVSGKKGEKK